MPLFTNIDKESSTCNENTPLFNPSKNEEIDNQKDIYIFNIVEFIGWGFLLSSHLVLCFHKSSSYQITGILDGMGAVVIFLHSLEKERYIPGFYCLIWGLIGITQITGIYTIDNKLNSTIT